MSQLLRVHCFNVSSDGFGTGEGQNLEQSFGHADPGDLVAWLGERLWGSPDDLARQFHSEAVTSLSEVTHHMFWRR